MTDGYAFHCMWSAEDGEYVGLVDEFPPLSWLAPMKADALSGIRRVTAEVIEDMRRNGEPTLRLVSSHRPSND